MRRGVLRWHLMQESLRKFHEFLIRDGDSTRTADMVVNTFVAHAIMCRGVTDLAPGAFRDFVARGRRMTHSDNMIAQFADPERYNADERALACDLLHDLIMEGL